MTIYSDKIDASYAKLKAVLAEGASAVAGFKSSLPKKSQVLTRQLSEEVVHILLEEVRQFVMHMTSASIDQVSGRLEEKLALLGEDGLMLSDETVQKIKDALSGVPGASSSVAQVLNGLGKGKRLDDLDGFFKLDILGDNKSASQDETEDKAKAEDGAEAVDLRLSGKDAREKFSKYLDEVLPKTKYFNNFFVKSFNIINNAFVSLTALYQDIDFKNTTADIADRVSVLIKKTSDLQDQIDKASCSGSASFDINDNVSKLSKKIDNIIDNVSAAKRNVNILGASVAVLLAATAFISASLAIVAGIVAALAYIVVLLKDNTNSFFKKIWGCIKYIYNVIVKSIKTVINIIIAIIKTLLIFIVAIIAIVSIAVFLVVLFGISLVVAALILGTLIISAALVAAVVLVVALMVAIAAIITLAYIISATAIIAASLVIALVAATVILALAALAALAILIAAALAAAIFAAMAVAVLAIAVAIGILAVSVFAVSLVFAAGMAIISAAVLAGSAILSAAGAIGASLILGLGALAAAVMLGLVVLSIGAFAVVSFAFAAAVVLGTIGAIAAGILLAFALLILGIFLILESIEEIKDLVAPYSDKIYEWLERIKTWRDEIKEWWNRMFIGKMLKYIDQHGGFPLGVLRMISIGIKRFGEYLNNSPLGKWINEKSNWWREFSFKDYMMRLWSTVKKWIFKIWNKLVDAASGFVVSYPNGISWLGWKWPPIEISTGEWRPFGFMESWKADVKEDSVEPLEQPAGQIIEDDNERFNEWQNEIQLTAEETKDAVKGAGNIFEYKQKIDAALKKKKEEADKAKQKKVIPQYIISRDSQDFKFGSAGSGMYNGVIGSCF